MAELSFRVPSMTDRSVSSITSTIRGLSGVSRVEVDPYTRWVLVLGDRIDTATIRKALDEAGHKAEL